MRIYLKLLLPLFAFAFCAFYFKTPQNPHRPAFWETEERWVDSVFNSLSPDERLGQLFMIPAWSNKDYKHVREVRELIEKYKIGGIIFMQGGPVRQAKLSNYYQKKSKVPLMISIDGEWGLAMRLDSTPSYPKQMTLGAIRNDSLIYFMGKQIARECQRLGIHVNFAPVADVNNNPLNPVISMRSFGENKYKVAQKAYYYMAGMQDQGVLANGKHFPGHGDTDKDSHKTLPTIKRSSAEMDSLELYPFKYLFERKLGSIMVAHLQVPAYDTTKNRASTLSYNIVSELLQNKMNFKGLIFTDALNMKGASEFNEPGVVDYKALLAGNDVLLFTENVGRAIEEIKKGISKGEITLATIEAHVRKILKAKYWCKTQENRFVQLKNLHSDLNTSYSDFLNTRLFEASATLLKNQNDFLPIKRPDTLKIATVSVGDENPDKFTETFNRYFKADHYSISHTAKKEEYDSLYARLKKNNLVILLINKTSIKPDKNFGFSENSKILCDSICRIKKTVSCFFTNPYLFNLVNFQNQSIALFQLYENNRFTQKVAAEIIAGAVKVDGQLPISAGKFKSGDGLSIQQIIRIKYTQAEDAGMLKNRLSGIDSLANIGIEEKCYPGCSIIAMKDGKVFYRKTFGKFTYEGNEIVYPSSLYDMASVTKIVASGLLAMDLYGKSKIDMDQTLANYLPELKGTNKENIVLRKMFTHHAGLLAWIPFYGKTTSKNGEWKPYYYSEKQNKDYPIQIAANMFTRKSFSDSVYVKITESKLEKEGEYVYSDLGFYYFKKIAEKVYGKDFASVLQEKFYQPLGMTRTTYLPLQKFQPQEIVPTENDTKFRKQILQGYVHDQGAALLGGIGGHAGVFSTADDMAIYMQMLLNKGEYGGRRYLKDYVVDEFTQSCCYCPEIRRGIIFDKPETQAEKDSPVTKECSPESFGHSGFTGTFVWADPKNNLVFIFLSNRVYPSADENKLAKSGIRGKMHRIFYESVNVNQLFY